MRLNSSIKAMRILSKLFPVLLLASTAALVAGTRQTAVQGPTDPGQRVFETVCATCHSLNPPMKTAPPMLMVARHYQMGGVDDPWGAMRSWVLNPDSARSLLPAHAIERFGVMPPLVISESDADAVIAYIKAEFEKADTTGGMGMQGMGQGSGMQGMGQGSGMPCMGQGSGMQGMGQGSGMQGMGQGSGMQGMGQGSGMPCMGQGSGMQGMGQGSGMRGMGQGSGMQGMGQGSGMPCMGQGSGMQGMGQGSGMQCKRQGMNPSPGTPRSPSMMGPTSPCGRVGSN